MPSSEQIDVLGLLGFAFGVLSFLVSFVFNRRITRESRRQQDVASHYDRVSDFHGEIADYPSAFALYGASLEDLDVHEIDLEQVRYLIRYLIALEARIKYDDETAKEHMQRCAYCRNVFSHEVTHKVYEKVRPVISDVVCTGVDEYLREKYGLAFPAQWAARGFKEEPV